MINLKMPGVLKQTAVSVADEIEALDIIEWARDGDLGSLPDASARAFGRWLDANWGEWTEDLEATVKDVLEGAVVDWCGGRTLG